MLFDREDMDLAMDLFGPNPNNSPSADDIRKMEKEILSQKAEREEFVRKMDKSKRKIKTSSSTEELKQNMKEFLNMVKENYK